MANSILYGFHELADVLDDTVDGAGVRRVETAVQAAVDFHNRETNELLALFSRETTDYMTKYRSISTTSLEELDENGRARKIRGGVDYQIALPMETAGRAWGANWLARQKMTVRAANDTTRQLLIADKVWLRFKLMQALFLYNSRVYDDPEHGELTIRGLARSNDGVLYPMNGGLNDSDDHYLAQADPISDSDNPLPAYAVELTEHPENAGEVVFLVSTTVYNQIAELTSFLPEPDKNVRVNDQAVELVSMISTAGYPGTYRGYVVNAGYVFEWPALPAGYGVALTTDGEAPIAMRVDENPRLRGFKKVAEREDYPFWEAQYIRMCGFGGWNRVGALVFLIGNGTFTAPALYAR